MKKSILFFLMLFVAVACSKEKLIGPGSDSAEPAHFLSESEYTTLKVQVLYVKDHAPLQGTLDNLRNFLLSHLHKPGGIEIITTEIETPGKQVYSVDDIAAIEKLHRSAFRKDATVSAFVFFADGDYAENRGDAKVLGIAYGSSSMCVFEKTVREFSGLLTGPSRQTLESTVLHHEFGHVLGLVNNGAVLTSDHQDELHGKHCVNEKCLMYYATETSDIVKRLLEETVPELDEACRADLAAAGGK